MAKLRTLNRDDVDRIAQLDSVRSATFFRDPDRPDSRYVRSRGPVPAEVRRAQGRLRTAHYRAELDRRKAPTTRDLGMALAVALATTPRLNTLTRSDFDLIRRALLDLQARGFDMAEARKTMRRLRSRLMDPADREGEADEGCSELPF
jgi:hypothetical protein